jgi:hypothetical protein
MFATYPSNEFPLPEALLAPGERCWRAVEVMTTLPWFHLTFRSSGDEEEGAARYMLFASLSDLVSALKTSTRLEVIQILAMRFQGDGLASQARDVLEVWEARDADGAPVCFVREASGAEFEALSYAPLEEALCDRRLVRRVGERVDAAGSLTTSARRAAGAQE